MLFVDLQSILLNPFYLRVSSLSLVILILTDWYSSRNGSTIGLIRFYTVGIYRRQSNQVTQRNSNLNKKFLATNEHLTSSRLLSSSLAFKTFSFLMLIEESLPKIQYILSSYNCACFLLPSLVFILRN